MTITSRPPGATTKIQGALRRMPPAAVPLALICLAGAGFLAATSSGDFLSANSLHAFLQYLSLPILIGLAQMITLSVGQLNLAVGAIGGFASCLAGLLIADYGLPPWLGALVAVLAGSAAGFANGLIVVTTRINGFIVTLATMTILTGVQYGLVGTRSISSSAWRPLAAVGDAAPAGVPLIFLIALAVSVLVSLGFKHTLQGRQLLASGGNALAAELSGISNNRSIVAAHMLSGTLCGVAAFVSLASLPAVNQSIGGDWLLPSFAAPIIGGVSLVGGSVAVLGTVLAAVIVRLVDAGRAEFSLATSWVNLVIGAVVLGTVIIGRLDERRTHARRARIAEPSPVGGTPARSNESARENPGEA